MASPLPNISLAFAVPVAGTAAQRKAAAQRPGTSGALASSRGERRRRKKKIGGGGRQEEEAALSASLPPAMLPPRPSTTSALARPGRGGAASRSKKVTAVKFTIQRPPARSGAKVGWDDGGGGGGGAGGSGGGGGNQGARYGSDDGDDSDGGGDGGAQSVSYTELHSLRVRRHRNEADRLVRERAAVSVKAAALAVPASGPGGSSQNRQNLWDVPQKAAKPSPAAAAEGAGAGVGADTAAAKEVEIAASRKRQQDRKRRGKLKKKRAARAAEEEEEAGRHGGSDGGEERDMDPAGAARRRAGGAGGAGSSSSSNNASLGALAPLFPSTAMALAFDEALCFHDHARLRPREHLDLQGWAVTAETVALVARLLPDLQGLDVHNCAGVDDTAIAQLRGCRKLQSLNLEGTAVTDRGVLALRQSNAHLTSLNLSGSGVGDGALGALVQGCKRLSHLQLRGCHSITDKGLEALGNAMKLLHALRELDISGCRRVSDRGMLAMVASARDMTVLKAADCPGLSDLFLMAYASRASSFVRLRHVDLSGVRIHDSGLGWLSQTAEFLTEVCLARCADITEIGLRLLANHRGCRLLRVLRLPGCALLTDAGLAGFLSLKGALLEELDVTGCALMTNLAMRAIAESCPALRRLNMAGVSLVNDAGVRLLVEGCERLEWLNMAAIRGSRIPRVTDEGLALLGGAPALRSMSIGLARISDRGVHALVAGRGGAGARLRTLSFAQCDQLADGSLLAIGHCCPQLEELDLCGTRNLTDDGVVAIARGCPLLRRLSLRGADKLTDASIIAVSESCPALETLIVNGCELTDACLVAFGKANFALHALDLQNTRRITHVGLGALGDIEFRGGSVVRGCPKLSLLRLTDCEASERDIRTLALRLPFGKSAGSRKGIVPVSRSYRAQNELVWLHYAEGVAVSGIQKCQRGYAARVRVASMRAARRRAMAKAEKHAILTIQRYGRGYVARRFYLEQKRAKAERERMLNRAASSLQTFSRMYFSRKRFKMMVKELGRKSTILIDRRQHGAREMQRVFRGCKGRFLAHRLWCRKMRLAYTMQRIVRGRKGRARARRQAAWVRLCSAGAALVQRVWRGYRARKLYYKKRVTETACVWTIQTIWRGHRARRAVHGRLLRFSRAAHVLQLAGIGYLQVRQAVRDTKAFADRMMLHRWAARTIEAMYWAHMQGRKVLRERARREFWAASRITCRWLRWVKETLAARRLQALYRGRLGRRRAQLQKKLNLVAGSRSDDSSVQSFRRRRMLRSGSALRIQQWAREILVRLFAEIERKKREVQLAARMQARLRGKWARRRAFAWRQRAFVMAGRIQRMYTHWRNYRSFVEAYRALKVRQRQEVLAEKKKRLKEKAERLEVLIEEMGRAACCRRIQREYRGYIEKVHAQKAIEKEERHQASLLEAREVRLQARADKKLEQSRWDHKAKAKLEAGHLDETTVKPPTRLQKLAAIISPSKRKQGAEEAQAIEYSVLTQQTTMTEKYGIVQIHITTGVDEEVAFARRQEDEIHQKHPFFARVPKDMSSRKGLRVFLWLMFGHAEEVLAEVKIVKRVTGGKMNQQTRLHQLEDQGIFVMPHFLDHKYPWELQTKTHMVKHAKPIKELEVSVNEGDEARLARNGFTKMLPALGAYGGVFDEGVYMWERRENPRKPYAVKKAEGMSKTAEYSPFVAPYYNAQLEEVIDFLYLTEEEVVKLFNLFRQMVTLGDMELYLDDFCEFLDEPSPAWARGIFEFVGADPDERIEFSQFVKAVATFCMFEQNEMFHFCFYLVDKDKTGYIDSEEFHALLTMLGDGSGVASRKQMERAFRRFDSEGRAKMNVEEFKQMMAFYPSLCYPTLQLQHKLQAVALGDHYWVAKKEKMMGGRKGVNARWKKQEEDYLSQYRKDHARPKDVDKVTLGLNSKEVVVLENAFKMVGPKSKTAIKFKKEFKTLAAEQKHEIIVALGKVHHEDTKRETMKTIIRVNEETRKAEGRGLSERQRQIASRLQSSTHHNEHL